MKKHDEIEGILMKKHKVKSPGYGATFARGLTLFLYGSSAVYANSETHPHPNESSDLVCPIQPLIPAGPALQSFSHHRADRVFPIGSSPTWQQWHDMMLQKSDAELRQGQEWFEYALEVLSQESEPHQFKKAYPYLDKLVEQHGIKKRSSDQLKLDVDIYKHKYTLITHATESPDVSCECSDPLVIRTEITDSQIILISYQVALELAEWIKVNGFKNLHEKAIQANAQSKPSNHGDEVLLRFFRNMAIGASEILKGKYLDHVRSSHPDKAEYFESLLNRDERVLDLVNNSTVEFFETNSEVREGEEDEFDVPMVGVANKVMLNILYEAYAHHLGDLLLKTSEHAQDVESQYCVSEDSLDQLSDNLLGTAVVLQCSAVILFIINKTLSCCFNTQDDAEQPKNLKKGIKLK